MDLNLNTDLALVTTTANAGTITLPLSLTIPGRVITFKDITQTFGTNALTLNTTSPDTFEDGSVTKVLRESGGIIQLVGTSNKWYLLAGTQQNTLNISSLLAISISTIIISSMNASISTINFQNNVNSTLSMYQVSSLLYFNSNVFAGSKVLPGTLLTRYTFVPFSVGGLVGWYDAADTTTVISSGTNVSQWNDKSTNRYNAVGTASPQIIASGQNNLSVMRFNGTSQYFTITPLLDFQLNSFLIFATVRIVSNGTTGTIIGKNVGSYPQWRLVKNNPEQMGVAIFYPPTNSSQSQTTVLPTGWNLLCGVVNRSTGTTFFLNGTPQSTGAPIVGSLTMGNLVYIGYAPGFGTYWNSDMGEILLYNQLMSDFQRQQVEGYLAWKWGLQALLPASHPFFSAPPQ